MRACGASSNRYVSYRDLEFILVDRGVETADTSIFRWVQTYEPEIEK